MPLKIIALLFSIIALALLLISNLGTTFKSTFLPSIYLVQLNEAVTNRHIRYGVFNSCMYFGDVSHSCTATQPAYHFNGKQFAEFCGADMSNDTMVAIYTDVIADANLSTFQGIVLIMPSVILVFISFLCSIALFNLRGSNVVPFVGAFTSLIGFLTGAAGLALTIATFWKGMEYLEGRVEGLSHQWGPAVYLVGVGCACSLITLICFFISLFSSDSDDDYYKRETYRLHDYDLNSTSNNNSTGYDSSTVPLTLKQDNYGYNNAISSPTRENYGYGQAVKSPTRDNYGYGQAITSPTRQQYPSYHQNQQGNYSNYSSNYY